MIKLENVSISYGSVRVVEPLDLEIGEGEFFTLLGPSGCGKTTMLRAIAGFVPVATGNVHIGGIDVTELPAEKRDVGIVFQNYALFPHMTVSENVAFGLRVARVSRSEIQGSVERILHSTGISAHRDKKPAELSGGQQQRVAIARSLVMGTRVLLFDEPLSNLDAKIRQDMRMEIKSLQRDLGFTAVFVTHDQEEALSMSDRLLVFNAGAVEQVGTSRELYENPASPFVCEFVGNANKLDSNLLQTMGLTDKTIGYIRPEHIRLNASQGKDPLSAIVVDVDYIGSLVNIIVEINGSRLKIQLFSDQDTMSLTPGTPVDVTLDANKLHLFGQENE